MPENPAQNVGPQAYSRLPFDRVHAQPRCQRCGYNLHTQQIARDESTHVALVRCPECGLVRALTSLTASYSRWSSLRRVPKGYSILSLGMLVVCALAAYALYEHPPRQLTMYSNSLGFIGICLNWTLASLPLAIAVGLAVSLLYRAPAMTRIVALTAAVLLGYVGHSNWVAAHGKIMPVLPEEAR